MMMAIINASRDKPSLSDLSNAPHGKTFPFPEFFMHHTSYRNINSSILSEHLVCPKKTLADG
jgi:hypothetical protein